MTMPHVTHQGIRIHYQVTGEGPPLVLQHGFTQSVKSWHMAGYVDVLQSHYQLILVDARGHGASDKPHAPAAYELPLYVGDIVAVLDALHLRTVPFWGYSMGGWIGFGMAKYAPERVQALIIGGQHPYGRRLSARRPDGSDPQAFVVALFGERPRQSSERQDELFANDFRALAAAQQDRPSLEDLLPTMTIPCLLYVGEADGAFPHVQACVKDMPNATLAALPGFNHGEGIRPA